MYHFCRAHDYGTYFFISSIFFFLSTFLSVFWNFELYNRNLGFAIISTLLGPISRNIFVEIMPASSRATLSDRYTPPFFSVSHHHNGLLTYFVSLSMIPGSLCLLYLKVAKLRGFGNRGNKKFLSYIRCNV